MAAFALQAAAGPAEAPLELAPGTDLTRLSLQELGRIKVQRVYGASRYLQNSGDAPASVTLVDSEEIQFYGHRTLGDVLNSVNGLYTTSDRDYTYLGLRGFNRPGDFNSRVLLLVDGHRLNDPVYGGAAIGREFPVDVDLIDRVEIVRGPSFSAFGDNAVFGVVNVITKQGRDIDSGEVSAAAGSSYSYQGRFTYGRKLTNDWDLLLSGTFYDGRGRQNLYYPEYNTPLNNVNNGIATRSDGESFHSFMAKIARRDFSLEGVFGSREKTIPTGVYGTLFNDGRTRTIDETAFLEARYQPRLEEYDLDLDARVFADHYAGFGYWSYDPMNQDAGVGDAWGASLQATKRAADRFTFSGGADLRHAFNQRLESWNTDPRETLFESRTSLLNAGVFALAEARVLPRITLHAGLRYDSFDRFEDTLTPRAGLVAKPWRKSTVKFLYGTAFRTPNVYELFYADPSSGPAIQANPDLLPEKIQNYQLVWEQELNARLRFDATAFYYQFDRVIDQVKEPGALVYRNQGPASAKGLELGLDGRFASGWRVRLGHTLQTTQVEATGDELSNSPRQLSKLNLLAPLYRGKLFTGVEFQYNGAVWRPAGDSVADYWIVNWTLYGRRVWRGLDASLTLYNLFDQKYASPATDQHTQRVIPQDGLSLRVKLTYRF